MINPGPSYVKGRRAFQPDQQYKLLVHCFLCCKHTKTDLVEQWQRRGSLRDHLCVNRKLDIEEEYLRLPLTRHGYGGIVPCFSYVGK